MVAQISFSLLFYCVSPLFIDNNLAKEYFGGLVFEISATYPSGKHPLPRGMNTSAIPCSERIFPSQSLESAFFLKPVFFFIHIRGFTRFSFFSSNISDPVLVDLLTPSFVTPSGPSSPRPTIRRNILPTHMISITRYGELPDIP